MLDGGQVIARSELKELVQGAISYQFDLSALTCPSRDLAVEVALKDVEGNDQVKQTAPVQLEFLPEIVPEGIHTCTTSITDTEGVARTYYTVTIPIKYVAPPCNLQQMPEFELVRTSSGNAKGGGPTNTKLSVGQENLEYHSYTTTAESIVHYVFELFPAYKFGADKEPQRTACEHSDYCAIRVTNINQDNHSGDVRYAEKPETKGPRRNGICGSISLVLVIFLFAVIRTIIGFVRR